ncbi:arylesterase [Altererythrobacter sp. CAU 1778]
MWRMILGGAIGLTLAGCGGDAAPTQAVESETQRAHSGDPLPVMGPERRILAFGDSLFAGYNVDNDESYPAQLQNALRARGVNATLTNAGVSGDTTAAGRQRLGFVLDGQAQKPELVILELGGNDLLRQISPAETRANLAAMLDELREREIPVLLMGLRAPPNNGVEYQNAFDAIYADLAQEYGARLVPFFLEPVYDQPQLIQNDRVHPTAEGIGELVKFTVEDVAGALPDPQG